MEQFEKLGVFYLGRQKESGSEKAGPLLLYDSKDLLTHAVCVGMTGSGKTGLCIGLLEEAALDAIPAIVIDPKGDLANLLLTFPDLKPEDFLPWINEDDARKKALTPAQYAEQQAALWRKGLADWGQDGDRIRRLREAADFVIYTPGSSAGIPVSILRSFDAPSSTILEDPDLLRERVITTVTSLLDLLGLRHRPAAEPGTHPAFHGPGGNLAAGAQPGHRRAYPGGPGSALPARRGVRPGVLLPRRRPPGAGHEAQQLPGRPGDEGLDRGGTDRPGPHAVRRQGQTARGDLLDRPPGGRRADVLRLPAAAAGGRLDALAVRDHQPAGPAVHGRDLRLPASGGQSALQGARC